MTYFAFEGGVGSEPVDGAVEISAEDYAAAIEGMLIGKIVTVAGGQVALIDKPGNPIIPDPEPQAPTIEDYRLAINNRVNEVALSKDYNDAATLAGYASSTIPTWAADALAFVAWRDQVWVYAFAELDKVMNGQREQPTVEEFLAELPPIAWP